MADLPEFHLNGTVQLNQPRLEVIMLTVRVVYVYSSLLILVLIDVTQMCPQLQRYDK